MYREKYAPGLPPPIKRDLKESHEVDLNPKTILNRGTKRASFSPRTHYNWPIRNSDRRNSTNSTPK